MEFMNKQGMTSHTHILAGDFGGALDVINGGLECPVKKDDGGWHAKDKYLFAIVRVSFQL